MNTDPPSIIDLAGPDDLDRFLDGTHEDPVGIAFEGERTAVWDDALSHTSRAVLVVPESVAAVDVPAWVAANRPGPATGDRTPEQWRQELTERLRSARQDAQQRLQQARDAGQPPDPQDRDVAGWLAVGLMDLFVDPVTGAAFLAPRGAFQRLASEGTTARFIDADFQRPPQIRFLEASRPAQSMLTKLSLSSTDQYRKLAATVMNRLLAELPTPAPVPVLVIGSLEQLACLPVLARVPRAIETVVAVAEVEPAEPVEPIAALPEPVLESEPAESPTPLPAEEPAEPVVAIPDGGLEEEAREGFDRRLRALDAEEILRQLGMDFQPAMAELLKAWEQGQPVSLEEPGAPFDPERAEQIVQLLAEASGPDNPLDALIDAGEATLDRVDPEWLEQLGSAGIDLSRYRIIKIDD